MKLKIICNNIFALISLNYYGIAFAVYLICIYIEFQRVGLIMSICMTILIYFLVNYKKTKINTITDLLIYAYIFYNLFSFILFINSNLPKSVFIAEFSNSILPIVFYFISKLNNENFYFKSSQYILISILIGFLLQNIVPDKYANFMYTLDSTGGTDPIHFSINFRSFIGLTTNGSLSAICAIFFIDRYLINRKAINFFFSLIAISSTILTFRRSAIYVMVLGYFLILIFNLFFSYNKLRIILSQLCFISILILISYLVIDKEFIEIIFERVKQYNNAINERKDNWIESIYYSKNIFLGSGLGTFSQKAENFRNEIIPDGNYFRFLAEIGLLGILIFLMIILTSFYNSIKNLKKNYLSLIVVIMLLLQAIGSNIFSFQLLAPIFWFSIGNLNKKYGKNFSYSSSL